MPTQATNRAEMLNELGWLVDHEDEITGAINNAKPLPAFALGTVMRLLEMTHDYHFNTWDDDDDDDD